MQNYQKKSYHQENERKKINFFVPYIKKLSIFAAEKKEN